MTKEDVIKTKKEILKLEEKLNNFKDTAFYLGKRKMFIFQKDFVSRIIRGREDFKLFADANISENICIQDEKITLIYTDVYYDLYDSTSIDISWEEVFSTEEECIEKWTKEFEKQKKEKELVKQREEKYEQNNENSEYNK